MSNGHNQQKRWLGIFQGSVEVPRWPHDAINELLDHGAESVGKHLRGAAEGPPGDHAPPARSPTRPPLTIPFRLGCWDVSHPPEAEESQPEPPPMCARRFLPPPDPATAARGGRRGSGRGGRRKRVCWRGGEERERREGTIGSAMAARESSDYNVNEMVISKSLKNLILIFDVRVAVARAQLEAILLQSFFLSNKGFGHSCACNYEMCHIFSYYAFKLWLLDFTS